MRLVPFILSECEYVAAEWFVRSVHMQFIGMQSMSPRLSFGRFRGGLGCSTNLELVHLTLG